MGKVEYHRTVEEIRRDNLRRKADELGGLARLAAVTGKTDSQISQIIGVNPTRKIGPRLARQFERLLELPEWSLDQEATTYTDVVRDAAEELSLRDEDTQRYVLELIRRLPTKSDDTPSRPEQSDSRRAAG